MQGRVRWAGNSLSTQLLDLQGRSASIRCINTSGRWPTFTRHGIAIQAGTMFGLDGEALGDLRAHSTILSRNLASTAQRVGIVVPMPGTPFFDEMVRSGRLLTTDWDSATTARSTRSFDQATCSARELEQGVAWFCGSVSYFAVVDFQTGSLCKSRVGIWVEPPTQSWLTTWRSTGARLSASTAGERRRREGAFATPNPILAMAFEIRTTVSGSPRKARDL